MPPARSPVKAEGFLDAAKEEELAGVEADMALPDFFRDVEAARVAGERHAALTAEIAGLYEAWETA